MRASVTIAIEAAPFGLTLADLREFVERTKAAPGDTRLSITASRYSHPIDQGEDRISVTYTEIP